jgi:hypothetical protein
MPPPDRERCTFVRLLCGSGGNYPELNEHELNSFSNILWMITGRSEDMEMLKKSIFEKSVPALLPMFVLAGIVLASVPAYSSTIGFQDVSNPGVGSGWPEHVPPVNPPIDTPAFYNRLINTPDILPPSIPYHTLPGSGFGQAAVPVPAAAWLFGSGLLGLIGISIRKKA